MRISRRSIRKALHAVLGLALFAVTAPAFADDDPPDRVARLSYIRGDVSFQPSGDDDWVQANLNRPLGTGDKLYTDRDSRVEMEVGAATLRLDAGSSFDVLNLDDNVAQTELTQGIMNLHVSRVFEGQSYEVDTPTLAFVVTQPGDYRVDIAPDGNSTMITVFNGAGDVYGENNASYSVRSGQTYRFNDSALQDYEVVDIPRGDDFDNWVDTRNNRYEHAASRQYVSEDVIGYADLDDYGGWNDVPEYGHVWYPRDVEADWAPYRSGHWAWIDPWGWTWVDNAAWGFAPFHYGRWVYASNRWGWCPGPVHVRPIYAPALVAFVGGSGWGVSVSSGGPVGWFPLGPRDVYVPWYRTSRNYFRNVNVRNTTVINNTYITNVYNNYSRGTNITNVNYAYRQNPRAVTAVSRETFVNARAVNAARVQVNEAQLRNANVASRVAIAPQRASFAGANPRARAVPTAQTLDRRVIARTQPPPKPAPVNARIAGIERNGGQPLARQQLREISARPAAPNANTPAANRAAPQRVQVVGGAAKPQPLPARGAANPRANAQIGNENKPNVPNRGGPATTPAANPNARTPAVPTREQAQRRAQTPAQQRATVQRGQNTGDNTGKGTANNGLPSSRFAPRAGQTPRNANEPATRNANATRTPPANPNVQKPQANDRSTVNRGQTGRATTPATESPAPQRRTVTAPTPSSGNAQAERIERQQQQTRAAQQQQQAARAAQQQQQQRQVQQREYTPRKAPPQPQYQPRSEQPQMQRAQPQQQQQQMQRAPQPQMQRQPPPQQQRQPQQERRAPPPREKKDNDKDDDRNRH